uniref:Uncharacterized protein n=1 Tax=Anopheles coluzzii TaxID=1518534 RepID=A0A8W7PS55_ANOCL
LSTKRVTRPQPIKKPCTGSVAVQLIIQISRQCSEFAVGAACVECGGKWIAKIKRLASKRSIRLISTRDCPCRSVSIVPINSLATVRSRRGAIPSIAPRTLTTGTIHRVPIPCRINIFPSRTNSPAIFISAVCSATTRSILPWIVRIVSSTNSAGKRLHQH